MQLGYTNKATYQIVGINLRTGREWRNGRTGENRTVAPAFGQRAPRSTSTRYLRTEERIHIADRLCEKVAIREVARELGRNPGGSRRRCRRTR